MKAPPLAAVSDTHLTPWQKLLYSPIYEHLLRYSDNQGRRSFRTAPPSSLADTFRVLGDVTRVRILDALSRTELCVGDIAELLGLSESAVSHQLRLLRDQRLVRPRRAGQMIFYTLDDHHIVKLFAQGLEHVQERALAGRG